MVSRYIIVGSLSATFFYFFLFLLFFLDGDLDRDLECLLRELFLLGELLRDLCFRFGDLERLRERDFFRRDELGGEGLRDLDGEGLRDA